ncbi:MAG: hypothetical protein SGJ03_06375 [Alphaproteobacteria bacterium]|nr:hypothetical protein [Alphaproteobacteria bacterium]
MLLMALGLAVMAGCLLGIEPLQRMLPQLASMKFNTALCFLLAGSALFFREKLAVRLGLAAAIGLIGALTLVQDLAELDFGIDQLVVRADVVPGQPPGRMSPVTALTFSFMTLGLHGRRTTERWAEALAISVGTVGLISLLGYAFGAQNLYGIRGFTSLALHTAAGFAILAAGMLCAMPGGIVMLPLHSRSTGRSLWLGFGALTTLLIVLGVVSASRLHAIDADCTSRAVLKGAFTIFIVSARASACTFLFFSFSGTNSAVAHYVCWREAGYQVMARFEFARRRVVWEQEALFQPGGVGSNFYPLEGVS